MRDLIFYIHIGSLCIAALGIVLADFTAFEWLRGKRELVSHEAALRAHWVVTIGLSGLVLSGLTLFWPLRDYLIMQPLFWLKMGFVATLLINSFFIEYLLPIATNNSFVSLSRSQKIPLLISGAVSTMCWLGAFTVALVLF